MFPILNDFRYLARSILNLARNIFLPSRLNAPPSEACESVCSVSWLLLLLLIGPVILEDRMTGHLSRISAKLITKTTRECSFGYTDCYVLSA
jgi:hypothetical protein